MPQPRVINLSPDQADDNAIPNFFNRISQSYKDDQDRVKIGNLLEQYTKSERDGRALEDFQLELERSNISPSRRLEVQNTLNGINKSQIEREKNLNSKLAAINRANSPAKKTQASQPIDPEQLARIQMTRNSNEFQSASPSKKYQLLTDNGVSKENAEAESKIFAEEEKNKPGGKFAENREKAISEYTNDAFQKRESALEVQDAIETAKQAIQGDIAGPGIEGLAKNNPFFTILLGQTPDEALLGAANKKLLEGTKGIFGSRPTEREIFLLLNTMLPAVGKTREANLAGLGFIKKLNDLSLLHSDLVDEITEGGTKYVPDLERQINSRMKPYGEQLRNELAEASKIPELTARKSDKEKGGQNPQGQEAKIKVKSPNGSIGFMTQKQIDAAKEKNVTFTPVQ